MDLIGYTTDFESLINKYTVLIVFKSALIILVLFLTWFLPCLEKGIKKKHNKHKTKRKARFEKKSKRNTLISQITVSLLLVVIGTLLIKGDIKTLNTLKEDLSQNSVAIYEGDAYLSHQNPFMRSGVFFDLIVDSRLVTFYNSDKTYWIDMSKTWEGWSEYSGEFHGKITYGKNSKFILKIE